MKINENSDCCFSPKERLSTPFENILEDERFGNLNEKNVYIDNYTGLEIEIYECSVCHQQYYKCNSLEKFSAFDENQEKLFNNWFNYDNRPLGKVSKELKPYGVDRLVYLCKVKMKTGDEIDFCHVTLYSEYPFFHFIPRYENIVFLHEISEMNLSEYSFRPEVRNYISAIFAKEANRLDLGTVYLKTKDLEYYIFQGISAPNFFISDELKGIDFYQITEAEKSIAMKRNKIAKSNNFKMFEVYGQIK